MSIFGVFGPLSHPILHILKCFNIFCVTNSQSLWLFLIYRYTDHVAEIYFLQTGGNMMEYTIWRKRAQVPEFLNFLKAYRLDPPSSEAPVQTKQVIVKLILTFSLSKMLNVLTKGRGSTNLSLFMKIYYYVELQNLNYKENTYNYYMNMKYASQSNFVTLGVLTINSPSISKILILYYYNCSPDPATRIDSRHFTAWGRD